MIGNLTLQFCRPYHWIAAMLDVCRKLQGSSPYCTVLHGPCSSLLMEITQKWNGFFLNGKYEFRTLLTKLETFLIVFFSDLKSIRCISRIFTNDCMNNKKRRKRQNFFYLHPQLLNRSSDRHPLHPFRRHRHDSYEMKFFFRIPAVDGSSKKVAVWCQQGLNGAMTSAVINLAL